LDSTRRVRDPAPQAEPRLGKPGKREFVQVLRLPEVFRTNDVSATVKEAITQAILSIWPPPCHRWFFHEYGTSLTA
jgi:hypothetical protein